MVLVESSHYIEVHIDAGKNNVQDILSEICSCVCENVSDAIKRVIDRMELTKIKVSPAIFCPCQKIKEPHCASLILGKSKPFLRCCMSQSDKREVTLQHTLWLHNTEIQDLSTSPHLDELLQFEIPREVGTSFMQLGIFLLNDKTGNIVKNIQHDCHYKTEDTVIEILRQWIAGKGKLPVSWNTLIKMRAFHSGWANSIYKVDLQLST